MMNGRHYCLRSIVLYFLVALNPPANASSPNIVLINADDLGYGDLGCYGAERVTTPHIDRLAREGRRFTDAHAASAVCSPSRYGLLTGRYPLRRNFWGPVGARQALTVDPHLLTLGKLLQEAGYATSCIGKWHLGFGEQTPDWNGDLKPGPLELGFDYYFGIPTVNSGPPFVYVENHRVLGLDPADPFVYGKSSNSKRYPEKGGYGVIGGAAAAHALYVDDQVAKTLKDKAIAWLRQQSDERPFFLYLATTNIHHPFTPARQFVGSSECGLYGDFIHELDGLVGEILATLDELQQTNRTLVLFTSDNGGMLNRTGQRAYEAGHQINGKLLGFKFGAWEGGHRVPLIARWPGRIPADTTSHELISQVDFLATFAAIVGRPLDDGEGLDSVNQLASLTGTPETPLRESLIIAPNSPRHLTVRRGKWVYIPAQGAGGFQGKKPGEHLFSGAAALPFVKKSNSDIEAGQLRPNAAPAQLYDLQRDPYQQRNLYASESDVVRALDKLLQQYRLSIPPGPPLGWINLKP